MCRRKERLTEDGKRNQKLRTIGLGGDGDEVDAIVSVERHFGVDLDYGDAVNWVTAGDVFTSLLKVLPAEKRNDPALWPEFATLLCEETGADASRVAPETLLLSVPLCDAIRGWFSRVPDSGS